MCILTLAMPRRADRALEAAPQTRCPCPEALNREYDGPPTRVQTRQASTAGPRRIIFGMPRWAEAS